MFEHCSRAEAVLSALSETDRVPARSTRNIDGICYAKALEPRETVRVRMTNQRKNNYKGD